jgi:hypothetical protein
MAYSKENCSVAILQKMIKQRWPGYIVIGNQPYFTQTVIFKKEEDQWIPKQSFDSNHKCFRALLDPKFHPEIPYRVEGETTLFDTGLVTQYSVKPYLVKIMEMLKSVKDLGQIFGINVDEQIEFAHKIYQKQKV